MARSLSNVKFFVSLVAENFYVARRGYAAASQGLARVGSDKMGKTSQKDIRRPAENSWVPDPATGYYKPANRVEEIDVAELREHFLNQKITSHKI
ncbi:hypothetical protein RND81_05G206400 [Saponaria officinalis]|uniref:Uncharacterized protein n=2 Tax=Saponaria officinalis TaxID=3572 RepID=A0AAW1KZI0_SAPOF